MMRFLDITDLLQWFAHFKRVSGVQRVSIEAVRAIHQLPNWSIAWFDQAYGHWNVITPKGMAAIHVAIMNCDYSVFQQNNIASYSEKAQFSNAVIYSVGMNWSIPDCEHFRQFKQAGSGNKLIVYFHDLIPFTNPHLVDAEFVRHWGAFLRQIFSVADGVCCSTTVTKRKMEHLSRWGITVPPVSVATYGLDHVALSSTDAAKKSAIYVHDAERYLVSFGTIDVRKNQHALLAPWKELMAGRTQQNWKLVLIGRVVDKRVDAFRNEKSILFLENAGDAELYSIIANANGVLMPTLAEGFCLPAFESLALGLFPIVTNLAEIREVGQNDLGYFRSLSSDDIQREMLRMLETDDGKRSVSHEVLCFGRYTWREFIRSLEHVAF